MGFLGDLNPFESAGPVDPAGVPSGTGAAGGELGFLGDLTPFASAGPVGPAGVPSGTGAAGGELGSLGDLNPFESAGPLDPAGVLSGTGAAGGEYGDFAQMLADPMDLFGYQAEQTRNKIKEIELGTAQESLDFQREILDEYDRLLGPFREQAVSQLPQYRDLATGGPTNALAPSPQYQVQTERGAEQINKGMAARGRYGSSARENALADMYLSAGQDEAARQYQRQVDMQRMGREAISQLGQGGRQAGANMSSMYQNTGNALKQAYQQYGQQRQQSTNQGAGALYGLSNYLAG